MSMMRMMMLSRLAASGGGGGTTDNVTFADAAAKALAVAAWDTDGDGELSKTEAAKVTSYGTVFKGQTIGSLTDETQWFGVTSLTDEEFRGSTVTGDLTLHGVKTWPTGASLWAASVKGTLSMPDLETAATSTGFNLTVGTLDLGEKVTQITYFYLRSKATVIVRATTPPTVGTLTLQNSTVYVPDASVDAYKAATGWSAVARYIKGISTL